MNKRKKTFHWDQAFTALLWGALIFIISCLICKGLYYFVCKEDSNTFIIISGALSGVVGAFTGGFIIPQLEGAKEAEILENKVHVVEFYHSFISYWLETDKMFIEHPECRKYFYNNYPLNLNDTENDEYQLVMAFAEYFDDLFRYSPAELLMQMEQFPVVPRDQIESYISYMHTIMNSSAFHAYQTQYRKLVNNNIEGIPSPNGMQERHEITNLLAALKKNTN